MLGAGGSEECRAGQMQSYFLVGNPAGWSQICLVSHSLPWQGKCKAMLVFYPQVPPGHSLPPEASPSPAGF